MIVEPCEKRTTVVTTQLETLIDRDDVSIQHRSLLSHKKSIGICPIGLKDLNKRYAIAERPGLVGLKDLKRNPFLISYLGLRIVDASIGWYQW